MTVTRGKKVEETRRASTRPMRRFRDRARFKTGLSIVPSLFTIGNMFCGYYSVASTLRGNYDHAAIAIGVGAVLDMLDGRIARMTNTSSDFGIELDSLADVLTFGIAPSLLALNWGIGSIEGISGQAAQDLYKFGWLATFGFLIGGALRLARFNVLAHRRSDSQKSKGSFIGLPIPAAALMIAAVVHFRRTPIAEIEWGILWCVLIVGLAFLMISTVQYPSFKEVDFKKPLPRTAIAGTAMLIGLIALFSQVVLLVIATAYVGSGPISRAVQAIRKMLPDEAKSSAHQADSGRDLS